MANLVVGIADCQVSGLPRPRAGHLCAGFVHRGRHPRSGSGCGRDAALHVAGVRHLARESRRESVHVRRYRHSLAVPARLRIRRRETPPGRAGGGRSAGNGREGVFNIGKRNYLALRKILWKAGVLVQAEDVGGNVSRTVRLEVGTGRFWFRGPGMRGARNNPCRRGRERSQSVAFRVLIVDDSPVMRAFIRRIILDVRHGRGRVPGSRRRRGGACACSADNGWTWC